MSLCGDESERCSASDQPDRLSGSSQYMLRSTRLSTSVAISSRPQPSVGSAPRPLTRGVPLLGLLPEPTFDCNQFDRTQQRDKPDVGAEVFRNFALNCWPWVRSLTHSPEAVIHSPAEIAA